VEGSEKPGYFVYVGKGRAGSKGTSMSGCEVPVTEKLHSSPEFCD
jgi:hypothetical protein